MDRPCVDEPVVDRSSLSLAELLHAMTVGVRYLQALIGNRELHPTERFAAVKELSVLAEVYSKVVRAHDFESELRLLQREFGRLRREWED